MRVSQRLFLAVMPAIVGVFSVAALAYWGNRYRAAPEWVVVVAGVTAVVSLILAWRNTRYVAERIERLAGQRARGGGTGLSPLHAVRNVALPRAGESPDELDSIEDVVDRLSAAVTDAEAGGRERVAAATERVEEYALLLAEASAAVTRQLDEIRIPLHILLENHFGQLNPNQEEMLEAARRAAEAAETEVHRLHEIAQMDRGALGIRRDPVRLGDVLRALRPQLQADAERTGAQLLLDVAPGLPRIVGDRVRLQEAVELLLRHIIRHAAPGSALTVTAIASGKSVEVMVDGGPAPTLDADIALARRIILAHGGRLEQREGRTVVTLG